MIRKQIVFVALLASTLVSCIETYLKKEVDGEPYTVMESGTLHIGDAADDSAPIHPAVVEALLMRPELPWSWEGHRDPGWQKRYAALARELAPAMSKGLAEKGVVNVFTRGVMMQFVVSRRARMLFATWQGSDGGQFARFGYDLRAVESAFDPKAKLDVATVNELARFRTEVPQ